jgi:APA family basic amino acid/polyamine antiporter
MAGLVRGLTLLHATSLVAGSIIGAGIFLKTAPMAQELGAPSLVLAAWGAAALLAVAGSLSYAELAALMPEAGGEYVYLRAAYGEGAGFFFAWTRYIVGGGGIAATGTAFAIFASTLLPLGAPWVSRSLTVAGWALHWRIGPRELVALGLIAAAVAANCRGVVLGGRLQTILTAAKVLGIAVIVGGVFALAPGGSWTHFTAPADDAPATAAGFGAAMLAALWAFNGWNFLPMAAGEVRDPGRNVPRAIVLGMAIVLAAYGLANVAYFYALPFPEIAAANSTAHPDAPSVAAKAAATFLGPAATAFTALLFMLSAAGSLNGSLLAIARVPYALARDGLFPAPFARLGRSGAPAWSLVGLGLWAGVLACFGTFDQLTNLAIFAYMIFHALTIIALFILRRRLPDRPRPYRVLGYPLVPLAFVVVASGVVLSTLRTAPLEAGSASALILAGAPVYAWFRRRHRRQVAGAGAG